MVWFYTGDLISLIFPELSGYTRLSVVFGLEILFCIIAVMIIARKNPIGAVEELGLLESLPAGLLVSVVITLPLPLIFSLSSPISDDIEGIRLLYFAFFSPLEEEIIFRGFAFWMLCKYARLGFWGAVLAPSFLFGIVHLYQADTMIDALGIFGITTAGSIWFSWLLMRWENLWVPIFIHALMNGWWQIFEVDDTALGGYLANIARLIVIAISILITIKKEKLLIRMNKWFNVTKEAQPE
jgi:membrane protease YdiL (CAAX protease family)